MSFIRLDEGIAKGLRSFVPSTSNDRMIFVSLQTRELFPGPLPGQPRGAERWMPPPKKPTHHKVVLKGNAKDVQLWGISCAYPRRSMALVRSVSRFRKTHPSPPFTATSSPFPPISSEQDSRQSSSKPFQYSFRAASLGHLARTVRGQTYWQVSRRFPSNSADALGAPARLLAQNGSHAHKMRIPPFIGADPRMSSAIQPTSGTARGRGPGRRPSRLDGVSPARPCAQSGITLQLGSPDEADGYLRDSEGHLRPSRSPRTIGTAEAVGAAPARVQSDERSNLLGEPAWGRRLPRATSRPRKTTWGSPRSASAPCADPTPAHRAVTVRCETRLRVRGARAWTRVCV